MRLREIANFIIFTFAPESGSIISLRSYHYHFAKIKIPNHDWLTKTKDQAISKKDPSPPDGQGW